MRSFGGEGGRSSKDHIGSQGEGGGQDGSKKDHIIFERSLSCHRVKNVLSGTII